MPRAPVRNACPGPQRVASGRRSAKDARQSGHHEGVHSTGKLNAGDVEEVESTPKQSFVKKSSFMAATKTTRNRRKQDTVRYAVVGLGYIAQGAILPAFRNARKNSELVAVVSGDATKRKKLSAKYGLAKNGLAKNGAMAFSYEEYDDLLHSGEIDAVFIALPNSMHEDFTIRAAEAGVHVLCEKPMEVTEKACGNMQRACDTNDVRLMIAYRLHFEPATLEALRIARSGAIGDVTMFNSVFTMQVRDEDNIRLKRDMGGGPLFDIGVYCINAARMFMAEEPIEVFASAAPRTGKRTDKRFMEVNERCAAILRYPSGRTASFVVSFGAGDNSAYDVIGTKGSIRAEPAYEYAEGLTIRTTIGERKRTRKFAQKDQFAAELLYFSECIRRGRDPEPGGIEGRLDVRVVRALLRSAETGKPVQLPELATDRAPSPRQVIHRPGIRKRKLVNATSPGKD
mgnify:CR=1 FL=1